MDKIIEKIYELKFSSLTTPWNLMENALLDNYEYVKYYKAHNELVVEMKCINFNSFNIFYYHFDIQNKLIKINLEQENGTTELMFSRQAELEKLLEEYKKSNLLKKIS